MEEKTIGGLVTTEIWEAVTKLKNNKASDADEILAEVIKEGLGALENHTF